MRAVRGGDYALDRRSIQSQQGLHCGGCHSPLFRQTSRTGNIKHKSFTSIPSCLVLVTCVLGVSSHPVEQQLPLPRHGGVSVFLSQNLLYSVTVPLRNGKDWNTASAFPAGQGE